jgi:hypothetical protein
MPNKGQTAAGLPFDKTGTDLTSDTTQDAIIEISEQGILSDYTAAAGTVADGDTIKEAIEKLDGNIQSLVINAVFGSIYYVAASATATIVDGMENVVTGVQTIDGTLIIDGRNTVL